MKFAVACLLATASAVRIEKHERKCLTWKQTKEGFHELDTNHDGSLSYDEIKVGLEELAKSLDHTITDSEWAWIKTEGEKIDSATPGKVDEKEFHECANALFRHFGLCHYAREARQAERRAQCVTWRQAMRGFKHLDTDHNKTLSYEEIKVGVEDLAKSLNHTLTEEEIKWIEETGSKIDSKTPGKVDHKEFFEFANALFKHFGLCDLAREERESHRETRRARHGCVTRDLANEAFDHLDTDKSKALSYDEIKAGLEELAKSQDHTITKEEWEWIEKTGSRIDSKTPGKVDRREFWEFANAVFEHFGICHLAEKAEEEMYGTKCDLSKEEAEKAFKAIDTNGNGHLSGKEVRTAIEGYAKSQNHEITKEERRWLRDQFMADSNHSKKGLGPKEFWEFANTVANKYDFCGKN